MTMPHPVQIVVRALNEASGPVAAVSSALTAPGLKGLWWAGRNPYARGRAWPVTPLKQRLRQRRSTRRAWPVLTTRLPSHLWRRELLCELRTHEAFRCAQCGGPVPIGDWPVVHERTRSGGWPCCSDACADALAAASGLVKALDIDEHDRSWIRRYRLDLVPADKKGA